ncbi:MAG TPA: DUF6456 domain-containing protein [Rhizomicrobium sp.]|jgi:hypothetical protein|nr:DUF6456 domain-containing protein [Rhizomicrobium sp.]
MVGHTSKAKPAFAEAELAREARRIFRYLAERDARLTAVSTDWYALHHGARMERRVQKVAAAAVDRFFRNGWLSRSEPVGSFVLSDAGKGWLARAECADADPFQAQHQLLVPARVKDDRGIPQPVTVNQAEDPLGYLLYRRVVTREQYEAGERLRRDYTFSKIAPRLGMDFTAEVVSKSRNPSVVLPDLAIAAGQRFRAALRLLGPDLSDIAFDVCCALKGLEDVETTRDWPRRSAKVVLALALDRLATHYGLATTAPARGAMRSWTLEEGD